MVAQKERNRSPNQTAWSREWGKQHLDRLAITIPKGRKATVKAYADEHGQTVNGLVNQLLQREIGISAEEWKARESRDE